MMTTPTDSLFIIGCCGLFAFGFWSQAFVYNLKSNEFQSPAYGQDVYTSRKLDFNETGKDESSRRFPFDLHLCIPIPEQKQTVVKWCEILEFCELLSVAKEIPPLFSNI